MSNCSAQPTAARASTCSSSSPTLSSFSAQTVCGGVFQSDPRISFQKSHHRHSCQQGDFPQSGFRLHRHCAANARAGVLCCFVRPIPLPVFPIPPPPTCSTDGQVHAAARPEAGQGHNRQPASALLCQAAGGRETAHSDKHHHLLGEDGRAPGRRHTRPHPHPRLSPR